MACKLATECRRGLGCVEELCTPDQSLLQDEKCDITEGCAATLYCSTETEKCEPAGTRALNETCTTSGDCQRGLHCGLVGLFQVCSASGTQDLGGTCTAASDCLAGLGCLNGKCAAGAPTAVIPPFAGVECPGDTGAFRTYFEVPASGTVPTDFFKLSLPNEARNLGAGRYELSGFPRPANGPVGDMLAKYIQTASEESSGFGANQAITMRFSSAVDENSLSYGNVSSPSIYLLKIEPKDGANIGALDSDFGCYTSDFEGGDTTKPLWKSASVAGVAEWLVIPSRTPFMCPNTFVFRTRTDNVLEPNTLYALAFTSGIKSKSGEALSRDSDLQTLLATGAVPAAGDRMARPYACYAPARAVFFDNGQMTIPTSGAGARAPLAGLTLFRTQDTQAPAKAVMKTMATLPTNQQAQVTSLVKCAPGVVSPCAEGEAARECPAAASPLFDEYHGKLLVPVMQAGTRPYLLDGGYIEYTDGGSGLRRQAKKGDSAKVQGTEEVCFALTVPKSYATAGNRAIALYGHGTGGNFRSFTGEGQSDAQGKLTPGTDLASTLAVEDSAVGPGIAILSFDQPLHGPRRNAAISADQLYFNIGNPRAMRDNGLQAVADYAQFISFAKGLSAGTASAVPGVDLSALHTALSGSKRLFIGHSQGGTNGVLYLAQAPNADVQSVLLSGTGGGLTQSLLTKSLPIDFHTLITSALQDAQTNQYHPVLGLIQMVGERSDPINFGRSLVGVTQAFELMLGLPPVPGANPATPVANSKSVMHIIGLDDRYTPLRTASDLWRSFSGVRGNVPVYAANDAVEAPGQIGAFEISDAPRGPLKRLSQVADTGAPGGIQCNCRPTTVPPQSNPPDPPNSTTGACESISTTDTTTRTGRLTAASVVYRVESGRTYDGHFVLFEHPVARQQAKTFLQSAAASTSGFCEPAPVAIPAPSSR